MRREHGFSLIELLVAVSIMIVVLSATLAIMDVFNKTTVANQAQNDAQDQARNALDQMARQLRSSAAPAPDQQLGIDKLTHYDVVFQAVAPTKPAGSLNSRNVRRVRYCLDSSVPTNERIWRQTQTWTTSATPAVPSTASCPDPGWGGQVDVADHIVNTANSSNPADWVFTPDSSVISHISELNMHLTVDYNPGKLPKAQDLDTSVYFRNENQPPNATFTWLMNPNGSVVLNATGSFDPEGSPISYNWIVGGASIGTGLAFQWDDAPAPPFDVTLTVTDSSGLSESTTQTVTGP